MKRFRFTPNDFKFVDMSEPKPTCRYGPTEYQAERIADIANAKLEEWEKGCVRAYKTTIDNVEGVWLDNDWESPETDASHTALLWNAEEVKK